MTIATGTMLMKKVLSLPVSILLTRDAYSTDWTSSTESTCGGLGKQLNKIGWTLFYMAGEIRTNALGFNEENRLRKAVRRIIAEVDGQKCNCMEITSVAAKTFLGIPYVTVVAHSRHIQSGCQFSELPIAAV